MIPKLERLRLEDSEFQGQPRLQDETTAKFKRPQKINNDIQLYKAEKHTTLTYKQRQYHMV